MESKDYLKDLTEIKELMNKSSRFISLSGLSGIMAGIYSLIGAGLAFYILNDINRQKNKFLRILTQIDYVDELLLISVSVILATIITAIVLSSRKAKKNNEKLWERSSKRLLISFAIPLITGGIYCINLIYQELFQLIAPATLIFYGLACINASKYTLGDIKYLGITCTLLGLISSFVTGYGLLFWALGFGVMHIIYGTLMYFKYDRN